MQASAARHVARALTLIGAIGALGAAPAFSAPPSATEVLARVSEHDAPIESYAVPVHMNVRIHKLFTFHVNLSGTQYFKRPDRLALDVRQIPAQYRKLFADLGTPLTWRGTYDLHLVQAAGTLALEGVPKHACNVAKMTLAVDGEQSSPLHAVWTMHDGSRIDMRITQQIAGGYELPKHADADLAVEGYAIHASIDYGPYAVNETVADSVFGA